MPGTFIRFYKQMCVEKINKVFAYRFFRTFTEECGKDIPFM